MEKKLKTQVIPEASLDTKLLHQRLVEVPVGGDVSYADLSSLIGRNVQDEARGSLESARRMAYRDRLVFDVVRGVGLRRADDVAKVDGCHAGVQRLRRGAVRIGKRLASVENFAALPNDKKIQHNTLASFAGVIAEATKPAQLKKLEDQVTKAQASLPLAKTLDVFKG